MRREVACIYISASLRYDLEGILHMATSSVNAGMFVFGTMVNYILCMRQFPSKGCLGCIICQQWFLQHYVASCFAESSSMLMPTDFWLVSTEYGCKL